jgi:cysteine synthase A
MFENTKNILDLIGKTPLLEIPVKTSKSNSGARIFAKLETTNPTGSIKDRMAFYLVKKAEERGELKPGSKIIEVTSGNTGIAFAMISAVKGYKFTAVMPKSVSIERVKMMKLFGANIVLTPAKEDISGAVKKYEKLVKKNKDAWLPRQFENFENIIAHRDGTGKEIIEQTKGKIDAFVAGAGTGGTLIGVAQALKKVNPKIKIIVVEPAESAVLSGGKPGPHQIQGIGEGFIPKVLKDNMHWIDEIIKVKSKDAVLMRKKLIKDYGILVGISSGANVFAAMELSKRFENVVTVLPDRGERYLSLEK